MSEASFGTVNIQRVAPSTMGAWWAEFPREGFTQTCEFMRQDHMIGSPGEKWVSGAVVIGYLEGARRNQRGAK